MAAKRRSLLRADRRLDWGAMRPAAYVCRHTSVASPVSSPRRAVCRVQGVCRQPVDGSRWFGRLDLWRVGWTISAL